LGNFALFQALEPREKKKLRNSEQQRSNQTQLKRGAMTGKFARAGTKNNIEKNRGVQCDVKKKKQKKKKNQLDNGGKESPLGLVESGATKPL